MRVPPRRLKSLATLLCETFTTSQEKHNGEGWRGCNRVTELVRQEMSSYTNMQIAILVKNFLNVNGPYLYKQSNPQLQSSCFLNINKITPSTYKFFIPKSTSIIISLFQLKPRPFTSRQGNTGRQNQYRSEIISLVLCLPIFSHWKWQTKILYGL